MEPKRDESGKNCRFTCCSGAKLALGLLFILGGVAAGFFAGRCSSMKRCAESGMGVCPYTAPVAPTPAPQK